MNTTAYQMIQTTSGLTIATGLIVIGIFLGISLLCFTYKEYRYWKYVRITQRKTRPDDQKNIKRHPADTGTQIILGAVICLSILYLISAYNVIQTAKKHGMYQKFSEITWKQTTDGILHTPVETKVPKDITNSIIIFYRFGCPDCEQTYAACKLYFADAPDKVYWVSSRSEQGKKLIKQYPISEVPSGVYIKEPKHGISYILYRKENDKTVLNTEAAQNLLDLQH